MIKCKIPLIGLLTGFLFSCGLPQTTLLDPPTVVNTGSLLTLGFNPVSGVERYVVMYKFYWPTEGTIDTDRTVFSGDNLSPGYITPNSLGFIQMKKSSGTGGSYPVDSGEITLTGVTGQVILDFDVVDNSSYLTVQVTGANETVLYRRVLEKKRDGSLPEDSNVWAKNFFSQDNDQDYDFLGIDSFESVKYGIYTTDDDGLDGDIIRLFKLPADGGSYITSAEDGSITVAVVVYSNSYDASNGGAIDSIPVYLGTVDIRIEDWKS